MPTATPYPSPTATPGPTPVATPTAPPGDTPVITITPGVPSAAEMAAYNAARTPQVTATLSAATTPASGASSTGSPAASRPASAIQPRITNGACAIITLPAAAVVGSKTARNSAADASPQAQPVTTVVLTYTAGYAGQLVWVQMMRGGTLTATDTAGQTYDGSQGFFLTLDASGTAIFKYQAPNTSGTYQVLTRFSNMVTTLRFLVPEPAL